MSISFLIFYIIIVLMSVVIHEVSHGFAAYLQGDMTAKYAGRLTLNPLKHLDPIGSVLVPIITTLAGFPFGWAKPVPFNPYNLRNKRWGELLVAIAGPAANVLIALVFGLIIRFSLTFAPISFLVLAFEVVIINLSLALFNLIPIPPLDGSKILFSFLPYRWSKIRWQLERYSLILVFIILLIPQFTVLLSTAVFYTSAAIVGPQTAVTLFSHSNNF